MPSEGFPRKSRKLLLTNDLLRFLYYGFYYRDRYLLILAY